MIFPRFVFLYFFRRIPFCYSFGLSLDAYANPMNIHLNRFWMVSQKLSIKIFGHREKKIQIQTPLEHTSAHVNIFNLQFFLSFFVHLLSHLFHWNFWSEFFFRIYFNFIHKGFYLEKSHHDFFDTLFQPHQKIKKQEKTWTHEYFIAKKISHLFYCCNLCWFSEKLIVQTNIALGNWKTWWFFFC